LKLKIRLWSNLAIWWSWYDFDGTYDHMSELIPSWWPMRFTSKICWNYMNKVCDYNFGGL